MYLGRVIGTVVSTSKNEHLVGMKLLVVEKLTERLEREGTSEVAVDSVGAGTGEIVIVCKGSSARYVFGKGDAHGGYLHRGHCGYGRGGLMANLYTKTGDKGQTSLVGGSRVSKSSLRVECYGTIDEANSMLGLAYAQTDREYIRTTVHRIQGRLFALGAELASDEQGAAGLTGKISEEDVAFLEGVVDKCTETTGKQTHFVIPGVDPASAALHVARTIVRRAERHVVALAEHEPVREVLARYINRLSDAVYALARLQEDLTQEERLRAQVTALVRKQLSAPEGGLPPFSLASLQRMAQRAVERAGQLGVPVVFSAVDSGGNLVLLQRMEGALLGSVDVSAGKAYTANAFQMPTHELGQAARPDGPLYGIDASAPGKIVLFGGGFPYVVNGEVVGGIGVSGGTVEQDMDIAWYAMSL